MKRLRNKKIAKTEALRECDDCSGSSSKDEGLAMLATNLSAAYVDEKTAQMSPKRDGSTGVPGLVGERMVEQSIREEVAATVEVVEKKRIADEESESKEEEDAAEAAKAVEAAAAAKASVGKKKKQKKQKQKKETETEVTAAKVEKKKVADAVKGADEEKSIANEESESKETGTVAKAAKAVTTTMTTTTTTKKGHAITSTNAMLNVLEFLFGRLNKSCYMYRS